MILDRSVLLRRASTLVGTAAVLAACSLLGPQELNEFTLRRIDGVTLPAVLYDGTLMDGSYFEERVLGGKLILYEGGRFAWEMTRETLFDGQPDPAFPKRTWYWQGAWARKAGQVIFDPLFTSPPEQNGTFMLQDAQGIYEGAVFEVGRESP